MTIKQPSLLIVDPSQVLHILADGVRAQGYRVDVVQQIDALEGALAQSYEMLIVGPPLENCHEALQIVQRVKGAPSVLLADGSEADSLRILQMLGNFAGTESEISASSNRTQQGLRYLDEVLRRMVELARNEPVLKAVARGMRSTIGCDSVIIYGYDSDTGRFLNTPLVSSGDPNPAELGQRDLNTAESIRVLLQREEIFRDTSQPDLWQSDFAERRELQAWAGILLKTPERVVGLLFINYSTPHTFSETDKSLIRIFAKQAIVAIQLTEFQHEQDQQKIRQFEDLYKATQVIIDAIEEGDIYVKLLAQAIELTGAGGEKAFMANIQVYEPETDMLTLRYVYPPDIEGELKQPMEHSVPLLVDEDVPAGISKRAIQEGRPLLIADVGEYPEYIPYHDDTNCLIVTPLIHEHQLRGVLTVAHRQPNGLVESDRNVLEMLARQALLAVEKSEHIGELKARTELVWLDIASGLAGHSMKNKVRAIWFRAQALRNAVGERLTQEELDHLEVIMNSCQGVLDEKIDQGSIHDRLRLCPPQEVHTLVLGRVQINVASANISVDLRDSLEDAPAAGKAIRVGEEFLRHAMDIIIENAIHAMQGTPAERPNQIYLCTTADGDMLRISLSDTGSGIPPQIINSMFREVIRDGPGNGVGLLMARMIVMAYGGEIEPPQTGPDGTTITIRLPLVEQESVT